MSDKTEAEIEREKEAVAKMVGAKSAMLKMIDRHDRLVRALDQISSIAADLGRSVGEDLYLDTYYHGQTGKTGSKFVRVKDQIKRIHTIASELK